MSIEKITVAILIAMVVFTVGQAFGGEIDLASPVSAGVTWKSIGFEENRIRFDANEQLFYMDVSGVTTRTNSVGDLFRETDTMPYKTVTEVTFTLAELNTALSNQTNSWIGACGLIAKTKVTDELTE